MRITLSARSKILQLSGQGKPFRIEVHGDFIAGSHVDLVPNSEVTGLDVTICSLPLVVADIGSVNRLSGVVIDFDYNTDEFIISNRSNE